MQVLLVDDEEELVSTLAERLNLRGIDADWVSTSADALKRADERTFTMAVLDLKMPHIGGLELKRRLQAKQPEMKIIFLSGYGSEEELEAMLAEIGEDRYLAKPIDIDDLIHAMHDVLEGKRGDQ